MQRSHSRSSQAFARVQLCRRLDYMPIGFLLEKIPLCDTDMIHIFESDFLSVSLQMSAFSYRYCPGIDAYLERHNFQNGLPKVVSSKHS